MSWLTIPLFGGQLKIKSRHELRYVERNRQVPVLSLGLVHISFWSRQMIEHEQRINGLTETSVAPPSKLSSGEIAEVLQTNDQVNTDSPQQRRSKMSSSDILDQMKARKDS